MVEHRSIFTEIARLRWPNAARIDGEGANAVVIKCAHWPVVCLFTNRTDAFLASKKTCGENCKNAHAWVVLTPPAPRWKPKPHWVADLERD
jgi:hypothetical protein